MKLRNYSLFLVSFLLYIFDANSQSIANYVTTRTTGITYSSISLTGNAIDSWRNNATFSQDDNRSNPTDIGFDYWYNGTRYTQFSVSTNGFIDFSASTLNGSATGGPYSFNNTAFTSDGSGTWLALAPFYDDMMAQGGTSALGNSIKYLLTGTAPNRVLTIEWINMAVYTNTTPNINFQVKLYETTGIIDFIYGTMTSGTHSFSYTCGINAAVLANTPTAAQLKCQQNANTNIFSNIQQNGLVAIPASNSSIRFTPPLTTPVPAGTISFTGITQTGMTVNWPNWCTNETGYVLYNSTDNVNFTFVGQSAVNATSFNSTGLLPGTLYYWRVYAVTEGALSPFITGSQSTLAAGTVISVATGNWNNPATWNCGCIPSASDNVTIANTHTVTVNVNAACNNLNIGQGASGILQIGNDGNVRTVAVGGDITVNPGATLRANTASLATHALSLKGNVVNNGTLNFASGTSRCDITFTKSGNQVLSGTGATNNFNRLILNMGSSALNSLNVTSNNFTAAANFLTLTNGTFILSTLNVVNVTPFTALASIPNSAGLIVNSANATVNFSNGVDLYGSLINNSGTLNIGTAANQNVASNGGVFQVFGGVTRIAGRYFSSNINTLCKFTISGGTLTMPTVGSTSTTVAPFQIDGVGSTFNMSGGTIIIEREGGTGGQNLGCTITGVSSSAVTGGTLQIGNAATPANQIMNINSSSRVGNLTVNSANATGFLFTNALTVTQNVNILLGTLNANNLGLTLGGNWTNNSIFTPGTGTVTFNGTALQTIGGSVVTAYRNLTINNASGVTLSLNTSIAGVLNFSAGVINTGVNRVIITATGSVTGAATSRFVNGFLQKNIATGNNIARTFEVGNGTSNYLPINLLFANVSVAGNITASVNDLDHPSIASSCIDPSKSVNRYWRLTNAGTTFNSYSATCNFLGVPADSDGGSLPANYYMALLNAGTWTVLTRGTVTATSNQGTGIVSIGDFQVGERRGPPITAQPINLSVCNGNPASFSVTATGVGLTYQWQVNTGGGFVNVSNGIVYSGVTTSNLAISAASVSMNGNLYRCIVTSPSCGGSTISASAVLTVSPSTGASISISANPSNNVCTGVNVIFTAVPVNGGTTPAYQWKLNGANVGVNSSTYSNASLVSGDVITCILTSSAGCVPGPVTSNAITMTVNPNIPVSVTISASPSGSVCSGSSVTFTAAPVNGGTAPVYQWKVNGSNVGANSVSYSSSSLNNGDVVTCVITSNASCVTGNPATSNAVVHAVTSTGSWLGNVSNDWQDPLNWCGGVPTSATNVSITTGTSFSPVLSASSFCNNLALGAAVTLDLNNNILSVSGTFSGTGEILGSALSSLNIIGSGTGGTIYMSQSDPGNSNSLKDLSLSRPGSTVILGNALNVSGTVDITSGTINTSNNLTLVSDAMGTARIDELQAGADIIGNVTMQRYIPGGTDGWMFLCAPVSGATLQQWDDDFITGGFPGSAYPPSPNPSIVSYNEALPGIYDDGYVSPSGITDPITARKGYWAYIMGTPLTIDVTGPVLKNAQSFPVTYNDDPSQDATEDGWNLIANPYPSTIDWDAAGWTKTNLNDAIYMYSPTLDQYTSYVGGIGTNGGSNMIASSQAFLVQASGPAPVLSHTEAVKDASDGLFIRTPSSVEDDLIKLKLSGNGYTDETILHFNPDATNGFDKAFDAMKFFSFNTDVPGIGSVLDTNLLSVNTYPLLSADLSIPVKVKVGVSGTYTIALDSFSRIPQGSCIIMEDLLTGIQTDLRTTSSYTFTILDTTASPRFIINISKPILMDFTASTCSGNHDGMVIATGNGTGPWTYTWMDHTGAVVQTHSNVPGTDTLNNISAGLYSVNVSGNPGYCNLMQNTVEVPAADTIDIITSINNVSCQGSANGNILHVSTNGGVAPYSYSWSNGVNSPDNQGLSPGTYTLSVTDGAGCIQLNEYIIAQNSLLSASFFSNADSMVSGSGIPFVFTNTSSGSDSFIWNFGDGSPDVYSQDVEYYFKEDGVFTVSMVVTDGVCSDTATQVIIVSSVSTAINTVMSPDEVLTGMDGSVINIIFSLASAGKADIEILNSLGQPVFEGRGVEVHRSIITYDLGSRAKGVYYIKISTPDRTFVRKVVRS
ncbi:MAG TPA: PKD domain-containing protein [Bacteroidia bacterium]|jgi:hypothetical protein